MVEKVRSVTFLHRKHTEGGKEGKIRRWRKDKASLVRLRILLSIAPTPVGRVEGMEGMK